VKHYLLVFDRRRGALLEEKEFTDRPSALKARFQAERKGHSSDVEIVVLGADSPDALRRTHARYFQTMRELARSESLR
jgi:hypothetical protein